MTITEQALADLLLKYFTTLEPVGKDVTLKNEMKKVAQADGSTKTEMVPTKGDAYLPKDISNSLAKAIAKALKEQLDPLFGSTLKLQGTRQSSTSVSFAARKYSVGGSLVLSDGVPRAFVPGTWNVSNGVADWGFDESASQGTSKWIFFYAVPKTGDDKSLVIVASDNDPTVGPTGRKAFKLIFIERFGSTNNTFTTFTVMQNGNRMLYHAPNNIQGGANWSPDPGWTAVSVSSYIPPTAGMFLGYARIADSLPGTEQYQLGLGGWASAPVVQIETLIDSSDSSNFEFPVNLSTPQTIYRYLNRLAGSNPLDYYVLNCLGWVDRYIDP